MKDLLCLAQKVIMCTDSNLNGEYFHKCSPVYKVTNEIVDGYDKYLTGSYVLSVIGSGDQIFNMVLNGVRKIDAFDISSFSILFFYFKVAAVYSLSKEEYVDMFYGSISYDEKYDDYYYQYIRKYLTGDVLYFWDGLFNYFDWGDIYNSTLFSSEPFNEQYVLKTTKYLRDDNYYQLRDRLSNIEFDFINGNIMDLYKEYFKRKYSLIYLSNIIAYCKMDEFKKMLLSKDDDTIILNYLFGISEKIKDYFSEDRFDIKKIENSDSGLLLVK